MEDDTPTSDEVKWQVRHNPLYKPKVVPNKKKENDRNKCRKPIDE